MRYKHFVSSKSEDKGKEHKLINVIGNLVSIILFEVRFRQSKYAEIHWHYVLTGGIKYILIHVIQRD